MIYTTFWIRCIHFGIQLLLIYLLPTTYAQALFPDDTAAKGIACRPVHAVRIGGMQPTGSRSASRPGGPVG